MSGHIYRAAEIWKVTNGLGIVFQYHAGVMSSQKIPTATGHDLPATTGKPFAARDQS